MHPESNSKPVSCLWWMLALLLVGGLLLYLLISHVLSSKAIAIQDNIQSTTSSALATQASLLNVESQVDGRDILLSGIVGTAEAKQQAEQIAVGVKGVRSVTNSIEVGTAEQIESAKEQKFTVSSSAKVEPLPEQFASLEEDTPTPPDVPATIQATQQSIEQLDLSSISFLLGSATLTEAASSTLIEIAKLLSQHESVRVLVAGHTDNTGDANFNLDLSTKRAQSVVDFLAGEGIDKSRLVAEGFGDRLPVASNDTREGRSKNRRIEFKLINGEN